MNALLIPPTHMWVPMRLLLWAGAGGLGFREAYMDIETWCTEKRRAHPIEARYRWLAAATIFTEGLVVYKYRIGTGHITDTPTPLYISFPWTVGSLVVTFGFLYLRFKPGHTTKFPGQINKNNEPLSPRRSSPRKHIDGGV